LIVGEDIGFQVTSLRQRGTAFDVLVGSC